MFMANIQRTAAAVFGFSISLDISFPGIRHHVLCANGFIRVFDCSKSEARVFSGSSVREATMLMLFFFQPLIGHFHYNFLKKSIDGPRRKNQAASQLEIKSAVFSFTGKHPQKSSKSFA